jgi:putative transcriptional regulator
VTAIECGRRIKQARKATGITQAEAAKKLGMKRTTYATYEQGVHDTSVSTVYHFIRTLDLDPGIIFPEFVKERQ